MPFNSKRKMAMTIHKIPNAGTKQASFGKLNCPGASYFAIVKGAQDRLTKFVNASPLVERHADGHVSCVERAASSPETLQYNIADQTKQYNENGLRALLCVGRALTEMEWQTLQGPNMEAQDIYDVVLSSRCTLSLGSALVIGIRVRSRMRVASRGGRPCPPWRRRP